MGKEGEKNPYQLTGLTVHFSRRPRIASDAAAFSPGEVRHEQKGRGGTRREGRGKEKGGKRRRRGGESMYTACQFLEP